MKFFLFDFKNKIKCSYYEYGNYPIYQRVYYCDVCELSLTEKICEECYKIVMENVEEIKQIFKMK